MNRFLLCLIVLASQVAWPAFADIYAYTDAEGVKHITNAPEGDPRYQMIIKSRQTRPGFRYPNASGLAGAAQLSPVRHSAYDEVVRAAARRYEMDEALVRAVIHAESDYNPEAVSPRGASGLMQLMPATASRYGVRDIFDPTENIRAGVRYLHDLQQRFGDNLRLVLAAYNAGEDAVLRYGGVPPFPETIEYVSRVLALHGQYQHLH